MNIKNKKVMHVKNETELKFVLLDSFLTMFDNETLVYIYENFKFIIV